MLTAAPWRSSSPSTANPSCSCPCQPRTPSFARSPKLEPHSSTDPAHNLSDAFSQKFGRDATPVTGFTNLSAMEIDPTSSMQDMMDAGDADSGMGSMMQDLAFAIPGIDEAMGFAEVMKCVARRQVADAS